MDTTFINIGTAEAIYKESPFAKFKLLGMVQLLPKDPQPYIQTTNSKTPLSFGAGYKAYLVKLKDGTQDEITEHIVLKSVTVNGIAQIRIKFVYLPKDYKGDLVYLMIDRYGNGTKFYSTTPFYLTRQGEALTSRIDYNPLTVTNTKGVLTEAPVYQSVRLKFYYNNHNDSTKVGTYFQISTGQTVNTRTLPLEYKEWETQPFDEFHFKRLARAIYGGNCYINQYRNYGVDGLDYKKREGQLNVSIHQFTTDQDDEDFLNIIEEIIDDGYETKPFLSSSDQISSSSYLSSQEFINVPIP